MIPRRDNRPIISGWNIKHICIQITTFFIIRDMIFKYKYQYFHIITQIFFLSRGTSGEGEIFIFSIELLILDNWYIIHLINWLWSLWANFLAFGLAIIKLFYTGSCNDNHTVLVKMSSSYRISWKASKDRNLVIDGMQSPDNTLFI